MDIYNLLEENISRKKIVTTTKCVTRRAFKKAGRKPFSLMAVSYTHGFYKSSKQF